MKMKAHDGKLYAEVTLRDVVERSDVSDLPMLSEIKRLYDENAKLRELCKFMLRCMSQYHDCCDCLVNGEHCDITYIESDAQELGIEVDA